MGADIVQADYEELERIAERFFRAMEVNQALQQRLQQRVDTLDGGGWIGRGVDAFVDEMEREVFPAVERLSSALEQAGHVTLEVRLLLRDAEEEAAAPFRNGGAESAHNDDGGGFLGFVGDIFGGAGAELKDMWDGLGNLVTDPIGVAKGLWYGITHPKELWNALSGPYVEDWENGHPGRAIGRGIVFVGSILLGTKGADKLMKGAGAADDVGRLAGLSDDVGRAGSLADDAGRAASATDDAARVAATRQNALRLEQLDRGHSIARHGPDVTDDALRSRLTTGVAPDGKVSPTSASTRFRSYDDWSATRQSALDEIARREGIDLSRAPAPGQPTRHQIVLDHGRPLGDGYVGTGSKAKVPNPNGGKDIKVYSDVQPVGDLTKTKTTIRWNPDANRWDVKQHFPVTN